jgi:hypothetical protein
MKAGRATKSLQIWLYRYRDSNPGFRRERAAS